MTRVDHEWDFEQAPTPAGRRVPRRSSALVTGGLWLGGLLVLAVIVWMVQLVQVPADSPPEGMRPEPLLGGEALALPPPPVPAPDAEADSADAAVPGSAQPEQTVDPDWLAATATSTGIPERALEAYASADLAMASADLGCGIGWTTIAAVGDIESGHGTHGGGSLRADGTTTLRITGPALDGTGFAAIPDTDGGRWDGDAVWDRAVGPMQFIPSTWQTWGADGNGDGVADPNQIDDAALATARYLCASGSMRSTEGWRAAIYSYNHLDSYVDDVSSIANRYTSLAREG